MPNERNVSTNACLIGSAVRRLSCPIAIVRRCCAFRGSCFYPVTNEPRPPQFRLLLLRLMLQFALPYPKQFPEYPNHFVALSILPRKNSLLLMLSILKIIFSMRSIKCSASSSERVITIIVSAPATVPATSG